jgi:hypothetical protein
LSADQPPLACCLSTRDYKNRAAWIENLARTALRDHVRDDLVLRLAYAAHAAEDLQWLLAQERICCAFLTFDLDQRPDAVCVTITAPEAARESADMLFEPLFGGPIPGTMRGIDKGSSP